MDGIINGNHEVHVHNVEFSTKNINQVKLFFFFNRELVFDMKERNDKALTSVDAAEIVQNMSRTVLLKHLHIYCNEM